MAIGTPDWWSRTRALLDMDFTDLRDTPGTYGGQDGKVLKVVVTEDGLDFSEASIDNHSARHESGGEDELDLSDLPGSYTDADAVVVFDALTTIFTRSLLDDADADAFFTSLGITAFAQTLLDDADADTFLATLGFSVFVRTLLDDADTSAFLTSLGIDIDLLTLALPADTTISAYGKTLIDDADAATARTTLAIPTDAVAGTGSMRTLGGGALQACAGNDARLSDQRTPPNNSVSTVKIVNASVSQAKLKTSLGSVSVTLATREHGGTASLPGGQYRLGLQVRGSYPGQIDFEGLFCDSLGTGWVSPRAMFYNSHVSDSYTSYAQVRYVAASGEVFWVFILRNRITKEVIQMYQSPDHPCFGSGGKPLLVPHPFGDYDSEKHEIIVINPSPEEVEDMEREILLEDETQPDKCLLQAIEDNYGIDEDSSPEWPTIPVTVGLPRGYEKKQMGEEIEPIMKIIPKLDYVAVKSLRKKKNWEKTTIL